MSVNPVGIQPQVGYEKPKKNNSVTATIIGGGAGAIGGYSVYEYLTGNLLEEARLNCEPAKINMMLANKAKDLPDDVLEAHWESIRDRTVKEAKANYEKILKTTKRAKTKFAIIGGLIGAGIVYIGSKLFGKKEK